MPTSKSLYEKLSAEFADDIEAFNYAIFREKIMIQNDLDESGEYISAWDYSKPLPEGFKLGK